MASDCATLGRGQTCEVACADGYVATGWPTATFVCPTDNTDMFAQPVASEPASGLTRLGCQATTSCAATLSLVPGLDFSACGSLASGASCAVTCAAAGYRLAPTVPSYHAAAADYTYTCPVGNIDGSLEPSGLPPPCRPIVSCESLTIPTGLGRYAQVDWADEDEDHNSYLTNCDNVPAGGHCNVICDGGWTQHFSWLKRTSTFQCPAGNVDSATQPHGVLPRCGFFESDDPLLPLLPFAGAVAMASIATWVLIVIVSGSTCCCTVSTYTAGTKLKRTQWYRTQFHPDASLQKEIDEAEQAEIVADDHALYLAKRKEQLASAEKQAGIRRCCASKVKYLRLEVCSTGHTGYL